MKCPIQKQAIRTAQNTKKNRTLQTFRINYSCVFFIFQWFLFKISENKLSKKCWVTALVRSMTFIGSLKQFKLCFNTRLQVQWSGLVAAILPLKGPCLCISFPDVIVIFKCNLKAKFLCSTFRMCTIGGRIKRKCCLVNDLICLFNL